MFGRSNFDFVSGNGRREEEGTTQETALRQIKRLGKKPGPFLFVQPKFRGASMNKNTS